MVFKDHKLYCLTNNELRIFDFSGEFPLQLSRASLGGGRRQNQTEAFDNKTPNGLRQYSAT
ncbi:hypothetical protein Bca52824_079746 [Brassica carinata]|uniref:Uncharacterized protein n=1 Tax=Brassica carinata TaxID=52824 RepID=A0A8X7PZW0_BRACI|nr:hypothetical protein Bca52824_079746 [Brassica carinata]